MPYEIPTQLSNCTLCNKEYEISNKWHFIICKQCTKNLDEQWVEIWFRDMLGYDDYLMNFAVPIPRSLIRAAIQEYRINYETTKKQGFKVLAMNAKEQIFNNLNNQKRNCDKCKQEYISNEFWPYVVCKDCARKEASTFRELMLEAMDIDEEYLDFMPLFPRVDADKYRIDKVKADTDNRANQLNPNNEVYDHSRGNKTTN